jgi:hypothetical protein
LTVQVVNNGIAMPVRCMLREKRTGRKILSDGDSKRFGNGQSRDFTWANLPKDLDAKDLEVIVSEQNGLFTYGEPVPVPPKGN